MTKKFIFQDGVMMLNPEFAKEQAGANHPTTMLHPDKALAVVSSTRDIAAAGAVQSAWGQTMRLAPASVASMEIMQDDGYLEKFGAGQKLEGGELLEQLSDIFEKHEIPIGLVNKLMNLTEYKLNFIIDDSGSMGSETDVNLKDISDFMRQRIENYWNAKGKEVPRKITRWQEVEYRLHLMMEILAYVPTETITIVFLNNPIPIILERNKTPEEFIEYARKEIENVFKAGPTAGTPIMQKLSESLNMATGNTMHYLLTDGEPSDASPEQVLNLVKNRRNPAQNPITFISCTGEDGATEWMKEADKVAKFVAEVDDFNDERDEVSKEQGPAMPFTRGMWLLCQLVAAINPHDLDAIDESIPFTQMTMNNLMGRVLTPQEYQHYWSNNPNAQHRYRHLFNEFQRDDIMAHQIPQIAKEMGLTVPMNVPRPQQQAQPQYQPHLQQPMYAPGYGGAGPSNVPQNSRVSPVPQVPQVLQYPPNDNDPAVSRRRLL